MAGAGVAGSRKSLTTDRQRNFSTEAEPSNCVQRPTLPVSGPFGPVWRHGAAKGGFVGPTRRGKAPVWCIFGGSAARAQVVPRFFGHHSVKPLHDRWSWFIL